MVYQMVLRIPAAEGETGGTGDTRAITDWTPENPNINYDDGNTPPSPAEGEHEGLDYYVTGKDLKILFCKDDIVIDYAEPTESHFITASGGFYEFFVKGKLKRIKSGDPKPYDVVVLANTKGLLHFDQEHLDNLVDSREDAIYPNLIYDFKALENIHDVAHTFTEKNFLQTDKDAADAARVPMWGRIEGQTLNDGTHVIVPLMRSLAKIRISLKDDITTGNNASSPTLPASNDYFTYSIEKIEMVGNSSQGTLMPHDAHHKVTSDYVPSGSSSKKLSEWWPDAKNTHGSQNIPEGTEHNHLALNFYKKEGYFYIYAPETVNNSGQFHFYVYLRRDLHDKDNGNITGSVSQRFRMEFGEYNFNSDGSVNGTYMPVMRNHYYMYVIKNVMQDQLIYIDPWDIEVLPPIVM